MAKNQPPELSGKTPDFSGKPPSTNGALVNPVVAGKQPKPDDLTLVKSLSSPLKTDK